MNLGFYSFLAIQGNQGKHEYYLIQCPLRLIPRLFVFDEAEVPAHLRKSRSLDASRVADLVEYLSTQPDDYIIAPLVATIDKNVIFDPLMAEQPEIGRLQISLDAQLIIHDGQHRRAAIALFTLSAIYQATQALLGVGSNDEVSFDEVAVAREFWQELGETISEWQQVIRREVTPAFLRKHFVHSHTVTLLAIAMAAHDLIEAYPLQWKERLHKLGQVDWSRENTALWEGRAMVRGKMSKATDSVKLSASAIKHVLGLPPTQDEQELEQLLSS